MNGNEKTIKPIKDESMAMTTNFNLYSLHSFINGTIPTNMIITAILYYI